jgi:GH25 family lysozyme M1 (1,4-beta-N-acetylmuramidase)
MRSPKSPFWPVLCALWLAACTAQATYYISGKITDSTNGGVSFFGVSGVTVTAGVNSAITDAGGFYSLTNLGANSYSVTPAQNGVTFSPASRSVTLTVFIENQTNINFNVAHTISGQVTRFGLGLFGVELAASTNTATTDIHGNYTIDGLVAGEVDVIPSFLSGYTFSPTNQHVAVGGNQTGINFTATPPINPTNGPVCPAGATLPGVDVSLYQGSVDWPSVKAFGAAFAFARISDGTDLDPAFDANWTGIKTAGMIRVAYQMFEPGEDPVVQANIAINAVYDTNYFPFTGLEPGALPVVLDVEVTGGQSATTIAAHVETWISHVQAATGRIPMICTGAGFWDGAVDSTAFLANPLWAVDYGDTCPNLAAGWTNWVFWQFANNGNVTGITNVVDLDEFNGSMSDLLALANQPALNIARNGTNGVSVTWSTFAMGFVLQQNFTLGGTNWTTVTNVPSIVANQNQVILGTSTNHSFFRLFHP